jgi:hypothetical protein
MNGQPSDVSQCRSTAESNQAILLGQAQRGEREQAKGARENRQPRAGFALLGRSAVVGLRAKRNSSSFEFHHFQKQFEWFLSKLKCSSPLKFEPT